MNVISRIEAKTNGLIKYFTGKPCKNGHFSKRFVNNGYCEACKKERRQNPEVREKERLQCKSYKDKNTDKIIKYNSQYYLNNLETERARRRAFYAANPDLCRAYSRNWQKQNLDKVYFKNSNRRAAKLQATPVWADLEAMKLFYAESIKLSEKTGITHHVDHIVPLQNELVCGLHNQFNLQILTATENISKGNRFWPNMPD